MAKFKVAFTLVVVCFGICGLLQGSDGLTSGQLRLVNGPTVYEGRVEIYYNGTWGTVCDDYWDKNDATVVCRQLGYSGAQYNVRAFSEAHYGQGSNSTRIWLDDAMCNGTESRLLDCSANPIGSHDCGHSEDAGVSCLWPIRLVEGSHPEEGRVEIYVNGVWGTVCDDNFGLNDAIVVCRQLGFSSSSSKIAYYDGAHFGQGEGQIWLDNVGCTGSESRLVNCPANALGSNDCGHLEDASVACDTTTVAPYKLQHNCSGILYIPEHDPVHCTCSIEGLGSPRGRLIWKLGVDTIATGGNSYHELAFPSSRVTRSNDGTMATCVYDWNEDQVIDFTNRVAYGPDSVSVSFTELYDVNGRGHVIVTCQVTGMNPVEVDMVQWSGPCQGQTGFTCTLTSTLDALNGQRVTCTVTNNVNNNYSRQSSVVLQLTGYTAVGNISHNCSDVSNIPERVSVPNGCSPDNLLIYTSIGLGAACGVLIIILVVVVIVMRRRNPTYDTTSRQARTEEKESRLYTDINTYEVVDDAAAEAAASSPSIIQTPEPEEHVYENTAMMMSQRGHM